MSTDLEYFMFGSNSCRFPSCRSNRFSGSFLQTSLIKKLGTDQDGKPLLDKVAIKAIVSNKLQDKKMCKRTAERDHVDPEQSEPSVDLLAAPADSNDDDETQM